MISICGNLLGAEWGWIVGRGQRGEQKRSTCGRRPADCPGPGSWAMVWLGGRGRRPHWGWLWRSCPQDLLKGLVGGGSGKAQ